MIDVDDGGDVVERSEGTGVVGGAPGGGVLNMTDAPPCGFITATS